MIRYTTEQLERIAERAIDPLVKNLAQQCLDQAEEELNALQRQDNDLKNEIALDSETERVPKGTTERLKRLEKFLILSWPKDWRAKAVEAFKVEGLLAADYSDEVQP